MKQRKIYKNKKYIKMYIDIYKTIYMQTWKYTNIQKYRSAWRKIFIWKHERVYKQQKVKKYVNVFKNVYRKISCLWCFHLYLETYGFYHFLNQFVILNKNLWVLLDHFYSVNFDSPHSIIFLTFDLATAYKYQKQIQFYWLLKKFWETLLQWSHRAFY